MASILSNSVIVSTVPERRKVLQGRQFLPIFRRRCFNCPRAKEGTAGRRSRLSSQRASAFQLSQSEGRYCRTTKPYPGAHFAVFQLSQSEGRYCRSTSWFHDHITQAFQLSQSEGRYCRTRAVRGSAASPAEFQLSQSEGRYCRTFLISSRRVFHNVSTVPERRKVLQVTVAVVLERVC